MLKKIRYLLFLIIGIFIFNWVYRFFAGPESIYLILENKFKLFLCCFGAPTDFIF